MCLWRPVFSVFVFIFLPGQKKETKNFISGISLITAGEDALCCRQLPYWMLEELAAGDV